MKLFTFVDCWGLLRSKFSQNMRNLFLSFKLEKKNRDKEHDTVANE